jgi:tRNA pseudouridine55 synthase
MTHHGFLLVNKPTGWTSHDLVAKIRKILNQKSVGHCGTLDPLANGLMVILLGEATKLSQYILEGDKAYRAKVRLGEAYDTLDTTGTLIAKKEVGSSSEEIRTAIANLIGEMDLQVPLFSAVKIQGKRLHEYARDGEADQVELPVKKMKFWDLQIQDIAQDSAEISFYCTKGSYVRAWVSKLGENLGCGAAMDKLTRFYSDPYLLTDATEIEVLEKAALHGKIADFIRPMHTALAHFKSVRVQGVDLHLILNGQISHGLRAKLISLYNPELDQGVKIMDSEQNMLALIGLEPDRGFVIKRVFRY